MLIMLVPVAAPAAPVQGYTGTGYWIYVCQAAQQKGYAAPLNRFMRMDTYGFSTGAEPDPLKHWSLSDSCNNWASGAVGSLDVHKISGTGKIWLPTPGRQSGLNGGWRSAPIDTAQGLAYARVLTSTTIHAYKTAGGAVAVPDAEISLSRDINPPRAAYPQTLFGCTGHGNYLDGLPVRNGAGGIVYKDGDFAPGLTTNGTSDQPGTRFGNIHEDGWPDGQRFYASAHRYLDPANGVWYDNDVFSQMTGSGTHADPNSRCTFTPNVGNHDYHLDPAYGAHAINALIGCATGRDGDFYCRGDAGAPGDEGPANAGNKDWQSVDVYSLQIFVADSKNPTVSLLPGGMNAGGGAIPNNDVTASGVPIQTMEPLGFIADDGAGIRQIVFKLDGRIISTRNFACSHLYATPCPHSSGGEEPPVPYDGSPFYFDVSTLQLGNHTATITVMDGSGRTTTDSAFFQVTSPVPRPCYQDINLRNISTLGIPDACSGTTKSTNVDDAVPSDTADGVNGSSAIAPAPGIGTGIFEYALDVNSKPAERPLSPDSCSLIEHVIKSSTGAPDLSPRERNQIVSVTINLQAFATRGTSLGEQRTNLTVDVPSRQSPRYRHALGCP